jgi:hypothetical protein
MDIHSAISHLDTTVYANYSIISSTVIFYDDKESVSIEAASAQVPIFSRRLFQLTNDWIMDFVHCFESSYTVGCPDIFDEGWYVGVCNIGNGVLQTYVLDMAVRDTNPVVIDATEFTKDAIHPHDDSYDNVVGFLDISVMAVANDIDLYVCLNAYLTTMITCDVRLYHAALHHDNCTASDMLDGVNTAPGFTM